MSGIYLDVMESLALWFEARGSARRDALVRVGVAFSICVLAIILSMMMLFTVLGGIPVADWIAAHSWSLWAVTALVGLVHWPLALRLRKRGRKFTIAGCSAIATYAIWKRIASGAVINAVIGIALVAWLSSHGDMPMAVVIFVPTVCGSLTGARGAYVLMKLAKP